MLGGGAGVVQALLCRDNFVNIQPFNCLACGRNLMRVFARMIRGMVLCIAVCGAGGRPVYSITGRSPAG